MSEVSNTVVDTNNTIDKSVTYCSVKFTIGWLPGCLGFTEQAKAALAATMGVDKRIIRGNYSILGSSRDPLIQERGSEAAPDHHPGYLHYPRVHSGGFGYRQGQPSQCKGCRLLPN